MSTEACTEQWRVGGASGVRGPLRKGRSNGHRTRGMMDVGIACAQCLCRTMSSRSPPGDGDGDKEGRSVCVVREGTLPQHMASCKSFIICSLRFDVSLGDSSASICCARNNEFVEDLGGMLAVGRTGPSLVVEVSCLTTRAGMVAVGVAGGPGAWYGAPPGGCSPFAGNRGASEALREPVAGLTCVCVPSYVVITSPVSSADRSTRFRTGHFGFVHR